MLRGLIAAALAVSACAQTTPDPEAGRKIFESQCALCHGQTGGGGRGPSLRRPTLAHAPDDAALRSLISAGIPPEMPGAWQLHAREVEHVAAYVRSLGLVPPEKLPGNPAAGAKVFEATGCSSCHVVAGSGEGIGPELTSIGARRSGTWLRQALLQPATTLPEDFVYVEVATADGRTLRGIRANEDSFTIQLKDTGGRFHSFRKSSVKVQRLEKETPMPRFEGKISGPELDDLVAYLAGLRGAP